MRKLYRCLFLLSTFALAGGLWSCSDNNDEPDPNGDGTVLEVEAPASDAVFATSVTFKLKTKGAESYVYKAVEGANAAEPDPVVVYAEAQENGEVVTVTGDTDETIVAGLEGNKTYTVFFVFKVGNEYKIHSQVVNTPKYSQRVTIIKSDMLSVTFHVEVPADEYYLVSFIDVELYESYKDQQGRNDVDYIIAGMGMANPRYKGPRNITIQNGVFTHAGALNEKDYIEYADEFTYAVHPGTGYVLFVSQCAEDGSTDDYSQFAEGGGDDWGDLGAKLPNVKKYTEESPTSEFVSFTGHYAKTVFFTQEPKQGTGSVMVNIDRVTEKNAVITFTPTDDLLQYVVMMIGDKVREEYLPFLGGEDGWQAFVLNRGAAVDGVQQGTFELEQGVEYSLYIVGVCTEDGTVQTFQKTAGIKAIVSDKPAVELKVTPLVLNNPYQVGFNVKAPNADCAGFKYILNYTKEWYPMLNQLEGTTLEDNIASMVNSYGQGINDVEVLSKVNSNAGYDLYFSSIDDIESWLILESYNADEKTKLFYDGPDYKTTSAPLPAEEPVNSELFNKLQGNWMATMTSANEGSKPVTMPVTIAAGPEKISTLPEDVRAALVNYYVEKKQYTEAKANEVVLSYFEEYKERNEYYTQKYRNMNCLVATGFNYNNSFAPLATPWDLFQSTEYSSYNTDELFRDYGPKLFLNISKDEAGKDMVTVISTRYAEDGYNYARYIDPVADWAITLQMYAYNPEASNNYYIADFPVEISEDMNTITIKPVEQEGVTYAPGFAVEYTAGSPSWSFPVNATGIVLTRATSDAVQKATSRSISTVKPKVSARSGNHFRRTRTPFGYVVKTPVQREVFSMDRMKKNLKK